MSAATPEPTSEELNSQLAKQVRSEYHEIHGRLVKVTKAPMGFSGRVVRKGNVRGAPHIGRRQFW